MSVDQKPLFEDAEPKPLRPLPTPEGPPKCPMCGAFLDSSARCRKCDPVKG